MLCKEKWISEQISEQLSEPGKTHTTFDMPDRSFIVRTCTYVTLQTMKCHKLRNELCKYHKVTILPVLRILQLVA